MTFTDDAAVHGAAAGEQRVDRRIDALGGVSAGKDDDGIEVRKNCPHGRIGHVIGRHVDRFNGSDIARFGRKDALLQFRHLGKQGGLVADGRGHAPDQPRQFAACLNETEGVVHQEEHLPGHRVAQVLGIGQRRESDPETHTRRLVHLPENHQGARHHSRILHVVPKLMPFADALADAGKDRDPLMQANNGVHELHDQYRLANPGTAEQSGLASANERTQQIDDLDPRRQHTAHASRLGQRHRRRNNRAEGFGDQRRTAIERSAEHVEQAAQAIRRHRNLQTNATVKHRHLPLETTGPMQGNGPHALFVQVAMHLEGVMFPIQADVDGAMQRRQARAHDIDHRPLDFLDHAQRLPLGRWTTGKPVLIHGGRSAFIHDSTLAASNARAIAVTLSAEVDNPRAGQASGLRPGPPRHRPATSKPRSTDRSWRLRQIGQATSWGAPY